MKTQAKNVKIGMTIKWGVVTITVKEIKNFVQKNQVEGKTFIGSAIRTMGIGNKSIQYPYYEIQVKNETFVTIK